MPTSRIKLSWFLLLVLALRGLLPAGYMIDATDRGLSVVLCDSGIYGAVAKAEHAHHHHHQTGSHPSDHDGAVCPFAIAAANAPMPALPSVSAVASIPIAYFAFEETVLAGLSGPSRAQQSRAPPRFS